MPHRSVPNWNTLVEIKAFISERFVVQIAFDKKFGNKIPLARQIQTVAQNGLILQRLNRIFHVIDVQIRTQIHNQFRVRRNIETQTAAVTRVARLVSFGIDKRRRKIVIHATVDIHRDFRFHNREANPHVWVQISTRPNGNVFGFRGCQNARWRGLDILIINNLIVVKISVRPKTTVSKIGGIEIIEVKLNIVAAFGN